MKLSSKVRYGTRILADLAVHFNDQPVQVSEISKRQGITVKYVEQLLRPLKKAEYITSIRGAKGGYTLLKNPKEINLDQILGLYEPQSDMIQCLSQPEACDMSVECKARLAWEYVNQTFHQSLESITIDDIVNGKIKPVKNKKAPRSRKKKKQKKK